MSVLDAPGVFLEGAAQQDVVEVELGFAGGQSRSASPALDISEHYHGIADRQIKWGFGAVRGVN